MRFTPRFVSLFLLSYGGLSPLQYGPAAVPPLVSPHSVSFPAGVVLIEPKLWDYQLLRLEEIIVAHRQEITCIRFLDPLPCLATADMTGKVLLWATRPHPNSGKLLVVLRNTVITARDEMPEAAPGLSRGRLAGARGQRKVLPTPVTCIAFRHHKRSERGLAEGAGFQRASQREQTADKLKTATAEAATGAATASPSKGLGHQVEKEPTTSKDTNASPATVPSPTWEVGSMLFTGDELGSIKVWDLTDVLLDKLGPAACGAKATGDKAAIPPTSFGAVSHHFVHYRQGPLDGVGLQAGVRFRELIDIARVLRRGELLKAAKSESGCDASLRRAGPDSSGGVLVGGRKSKRSAVRSSAGSVNASTTTSSSTAETSRDRPPAAGRNKHELGSDSKGGQTGGGSSNHFSASGGAAPDARGGGGKQRAAARRRPVCAKEQAEATLNARPDDIHPVASWAGHGDCVTFMETISSPLGLVTGSLDSSARIFSLDGSLLGVMSEKQDDSETERGWVFQPAAKGRNAEASARVAALEKTLQHVRHEERHPVVRPPGVSGAAPAPPVNTPSGQGLLCPPDKAPNHGSEIGSNFAGWRRHSAAADKGAREEKGGGATPEIRDGVQARSAISAACLARISELTQRRAVQTDVAASCSDTGSDNPLRSAEEGIESRLLSEAREGREYQRRGSSVRRSSSAGDIHQTQNKRIGFHHHHAGKLSSANASSSDPPPAPKLPPNLTAERERKEARRTRSTLQFLADSVNRTSGGAGSVSSYSSSVKSRSKRDLVEGPRVTEGSRGDGCRARSRPFTSPGARPKTPVKSKDKFLARDDTAMTLMESTGLSPAAKLRHAVMVASPCLALRLEGTHAKQADADGRRTGRGDARGDDNTSQKSQRTDKSGTTTTRTAPAPAPPPVIKLAAMPPTLTQRSSAARMMVLTQRSTANTLFTQRSAMTLLSARSNRSNNSCLSMARTAATAAASTKAAVARRMAADRRLRRMDGILDGVRRLGQRERSASRWSLTSRAADGDMARRTAVAEESGAADNAGGREVRTAAGAGAGAVVVSARVREVLSRFERSVNSEEDDPEDIEFNNQADQRAKNMRRQLEARTAARQEAIRHNERYRRAQRYDLVTLQETQLRRQEAMVGLTGPSGERFGPYT